MQFWYGVIFTLGLIGVACIFRLWQFRNAYIRVVDGVRTEHTTAIVMLDYYRESPELYLRLNETVALYQKLKNVIGQKPLVLLTVGKLAGNKDTISVLNKRELSMYGIVHSDLHIFLGDDARGAADTYEEVALACQWLHENNFKSAYFVGNPLQLFQAYYIAIFNRIYPRLHSVEVIEAEPFYVVGKLLQAVLVLFDPHGWNPMSVYIRWRRRHSINNI